MSAEWGEFLDDLLEGDGNKSRRQVLVVDDSAVLRGEMRFMLTAMQCEVIEAADGEEGLAKLRANPRVALVFLDVNMPKMDGLTMAEAVAADVKAGTLPKIPIVMLTTENTKDKVLRAKNAGVLGWLIKPAKREHVQKLLEQVARKAA